MWAAVVTWSDVFGIEPHRLVEASGGAVTYLKRVRRAIHEVSRNLDRADAVILASARKHGVVDEDIPPHQHPIRVLRLDDLTMLIGPDRAARLLEVGLSSGEGIEYIVHAMPARPKFIR